MGGTRGEVPSDSGEIYIVSPGDHADDGNGSPPAAPRRPPVSARQAALLAIVGLLAFGIGLGVGTHRGNAPAAGPSEAPASTTAPAAGASTGSSSRSAPAIGHATTAPTPDAADSEAPASTVTREPWPTETGVCGYATPVPLISATLPLDDGTGLTVIAGGAPRRIQVDSRPPGEALFATPVNEIAADRAGLVAITTHDPCVTNPAAPVIGVRVDSGGALQQIYPAARHARPGLWVWGIVAGGDRSWLVASPPFDPAAPAPADAGINTLIATDGSGDSVTLPAGFTPTAAWRDVIIGSYMSGAADTYGPIQIYDVTSGGIVAQIDAASPQIVVSNGYMAWIDASCQSRCTAHRYELATGKRSDVQVTAFDSAYGGVGAFVALSPDGRRVAIVTHDAVADARYELGHPGGPARFAVLDLDSGELTHLPGVARAPKTPAGMSFSPDGRWLAVAVNQGTQTRILFYDHDLRGPYDPAISVPASTAWTIPLIVE